MSNNGKPPDGAPEKIGRGAALLAAYKARLTQGVRPTSSTTSSSEDEQRVGAGRANLLNIISGRGKPIQQSGKLESSLGPQQPPSQSVGRASIALGRAKFLSSSSSSSSHSPGTSAASPDSGALKLLGELQPPTEDLEKLQIGRYSGEGGKSIDLEVNYVKLKIADDKGIYEYHINFDPPIDSVNLKMRVMHQPDVKGIIGLKRHFDRGSKLYLPIKLSSETTVKTKLPTDESEVTVVIKYIGPCKARDMIPFYNGLFRKIMSILKMVQIGRNYFDPRGNIPVPQHRLEIWPGHITAIQEFEGGVMLNCDSSFRVLRSITAREVIMEAMQKKQMKEEIGRLIVGSIVLTKYNNKNYRIDDIAWDSHPTSTFTSHDGTEISFVDYYKRNYDISICDMKQPLLISQPKKNLDEKSKLLCLIPELCNMTGLTDEMRSDHRMMRDIATHTRVSPEKRQFCFQTFIENIFKTPEAIKVLHDWNLDINEGLVSLNGRLLNPESIMVKGKTIRVSSTADWGRDITSTECLVSVNLENWFIAYVKRDNAKVHEFINMMKKVCPTMGIKVNSPQLIELPNDRTDQYCNMLRKNINPNVQIAVVVFPNPRDDRYSAVKKVCCLEKPIPSQCINVRTISQFQKLRSVTQKIALQINCKLGGELWGVPVPMQNMMICGLDTYHDAAHRNRSILGFVASTSRNVTRWFSQTAIQTSGQELADSLHVIFNRALKKYHSINHTLPEKIFIFRDGVGDGMINTVVQHEVPQIRACFPKMQSDYNPTLTVIIVQKRINTRLYFKENGRLINPHPGTILDHTVTRKTDCDFFLVSQHVGQGTVSPTHFNVVHNDSKLNIGQLQKLSYKMTHLYYNWPGTVRVPAPCQYAHKLAYLVGQNLHNNAHEELADKLFYL